MKNSKLVIAACFAALSVSFANADDNPFDVEIVSSNKVRFESVSIEYLDGIPVLTGKLKRSAYNSKVLPGHVDYIVKDSQGAVIIEGGAQYSPSLSLRRWKFGSSFSIAFPKDLPEDVIVQIGYHRNEHLAQSISPAVSHKENKLL